MIANFTLAQSSEFLSTLSLRRATLTHQGKIKSITHFYPRSPCGERRSEFVKRKVNHHFYPRSPCGERLWPGLLARPFFIISIHALLAESDCYSLRHSAQGRYFYPRSPCGERLDWYLMILEKKDFYPRSPCGERPPRLSRVVPTPIFLSKLSLRRATLLIL